MRGYSADNIFTEKDILLWRLATRIVAGMPEHPDTRCHEVARVVAELVGGVTVVDGKFGPVEHTWLITDKAILDCYAVGSLPMVQLFDPYLPGPSPYQPYRPSEPRVDARPDVMAFLREGVSDD